MQISCSKAMLKAQEVDDGVCLRLNCCGKAYYDAETQTRADGWKRWFLLIAHTIEWAQAHGYARMSLGLAPLAGLHEELAATTCNAVEPGRLHARWPPLEREQTEGQRSNL